MLSEISVCWPIVVSASRCLGQYFKGIYRCFYDPRLLLLPLYILPVYTVVCFYCYIGPEPLVVLHGRSSCA